MQKVMNYVATNRNGKLIRKMDEIVITVLRRQIKMKKMKKNKKEKFIQQEEKEGK